MDAALLLAHAASTLAMVGLVWFVQVVHYPLFNRVPPDALVAYAQAHTTRTTWVVAPLMLVEAASAALLVVTPPAGVAPNLPLLGLVLLLVIWIATAVGMVPVHHRLSRRGDPADAARLARRNWVRTLAWTARAAIAVALLAQALD